MKAITFITKSLKEGVQLLTFILYFAILVEALLYLTYQAAVAAHIPFTNFILFLKSMMTLLGLLSMGGVMVGFFVGMQTRFTKKRVYQLTTNSLLLVFSFFVSDYPIPLNVFLFTRVLDMTGRAALYALMVLVVCVLVNRVATNALFRQLFTEEFQSRCAIYPDEETLFYSITWIRNVRIFIAKHFRNAEETTYTPLNQGLVKSELEPRLEGVKAYKEKPIRVEQTRGGVRLFFQWIPVRFTFFERRSFIKAIETPTKLGTKTLLSNEKEAK